MRDRPDGEGDCIADPRADQIDDAPEAQIADRVGELEPDDDVGIGRLRPPELVLDRRLQDANHLPINIVDRGGGKEQAADYPAITADPAGGGINRCRLRSRHLHSPERQWAKLP